MTDEIQAAAAQIADVPIVPNVAAEPAPLPAVGDILPAGAVFGVRRFAAGGAEITFDGTDWIAIS